MRRWTERYAARVIEPRWDLLVDEELRLQRSMPCPECFQWLLKQARGLGKACREGVGKDRDEGFNE